MSIAYCITQNVGISNFIIVRNSSKNEKYSFISKCNTVIYAKQRKIHQRGVLSIKALLGPSGGFFGVGSSEVLVIGVVAWFILGPKRLYQLARDIGRISAEFKNVTEEARLTFQKAVDIDGNEIKKEDKTFTIKTSKNSPVSSESRLVSLNTIIESEIIKINKKEK